MGKTKVAQRECDPGIFKGVKSMKNERSFEKMNIDYNNFKIFLEPMTVPTHSEKVCGSDDQRPSNKLEPLGCYFWATLYNLSFEV